MAPAVPDGAQSAHLHRRFLRLTVLNVLANVTVPLVGLVDAGMLGHLAQLRYLAGAAVAAVIFDYVYWSLNFLRMSTTGLTAQARGRGDDRDSYLTLYRALLLAVGAGFLVLLVQTPLRTAGFALLGVEGEILGPATEYFRARIWSAPATLANFAFVGWFLGREESGRVLLLTVTANLVNIALNYLFILELGWAAAGAGAATALSQVIMLGLAVALFLRSGRPAPWRWSQVLDRGPLVDSLRLQGDILLRTLCLTSSFAAFTALSTRLGTDLLVANTLLLRLMNFAIFFVDGAAFALESLAGVLHGAGDRGALRRALRLAMVTAVAAVVPFLAALFLFPSAIFGLLTDHGSVIELCRRYGWWQAPVLFAGAAAFVYDGYFLGLTDGRTLRDAMVVSTALVFAPLAVLAALRGDNHLLWAAMAAWMAARAVSLGRAERRRRPVAGPAPGGLDA